jgi:hypothetical protein
MLVGTIMELINATFLKIFLMGDERSSSSKEFVVLIEQIESILEINFEEDNNVALRKSKRCRNMKYFGDGFII